MVKRTFSFDKDVREVDVLFRDLLMEGGACFLDGKPKVLSYNVRLPSRKAKGVLKFSYKFHGLPCRADIRQPRRPPYGYLLPGYRYAAPPPASQVPPKKSRCKIFMSMTESASCRSGTAYGIQFMILGSMVIMIRK
ncbi:hypothetical protein NL676_030580 [Syzygium grande]|nr:hypothetical protein NL676_030580 [Syzygium grande]